MLPRFKRIALALLACLLLAVTAAAQEGAPRMRVAVLDFGESEMGRRVSQRVADALAHGAQVALVDRSQARAAARGVGYAGSLNLTLAEARDLAAAIDCDFLITGDAQTLRRSSSARSVFHEAYASIFLVSARTGRLVAWERPAFESDAPEEAEKLLSEDLTRRARAYPSRLLRVREDERKERERARVDDAPLVEDAPEDGSAAAENFRAPAPYRRLRPVYPETASRAEAEATVDVSVEVGADGEVGRVEVVRWAGFGLDEAVVAAVRRMHFRPAMRAGETMPVRVLLRYNFRRPAKSD